MKRLLKPTGSIYVHCDWHASHYIKVEMDKIFGYESFRNEIAWCYSGGGTPRNDFPRKHDTLLRYCKGSDWKFYVERKPYKENTQQVGKHSTYSGGDDIDLKRGTPVTSWWTDIQTVTGWNPQRVGYPTQKPEELIERVLRVSTDEGDLVLDAFSGGGGTGVVAQRLGRRWIMIDQSRVAVAVTAERLKDDAVTRELDSYELPDFTVEHWGVYEAEKLSTMPAEDFRQFVLHCFDARIPSEDSGIHGYKGSGSRIPVWVGAPGRRDRASVADVNAFAEAITNLDRYQQEGLLDGTMLAWGFRRDAQDAARLLRERDGLEIGLVRLNQIALESPEFRSHIASQSTERGDYSEFLTFVQPPLVEIAHKRIRGATYNFSAGGSQVFNANAKLINVQWDFNHRDGVFRAEPETWYGKRKKSEGPPLTAQHTFPHVGRFVVACKVQDDKGGEGMATVKVKVE